MTVVEEQKLKKCPFCQFVNVYEDIITHHIKFTDDAAHTGIEVDNLDKSSYVIAESKPKPSQYGPYIRTEDLPLPWINCLWCGYRDKIAFDLSLHFLEEHLEELLAIPITRRERLAAKTLSGDWFARFESPMEYRLDKALGMAWQTEVRLTGGLGNGR